MSEVRYTDQHEWVRIDGDQATIGITKYAAEQLGDVVYVEIPESGRKVGAVRLLELGQGPDLDLEHLEGVEHGHGHGVCPLVGQVTPDARSQTLVGLAYINGLAVVVEEGIDAPTVVADKRP